MGRRGRELIKKECGGLTREPSEAEHRFFNKNYLGY